MAVSPLEQYPFAGRMLLFLFPAIHLALAEGVTRLRIGRRAFAGAALVAAAAQIALVAGLIRMPAYDRRYVQEFEPVLAHVEHHRQAGDVIYLYHWSEPAFRHYAPRHGFDYDDCELITPMPETRLLKEIDYFRGKRGARPASPDTVSCVLGVSEFHEQARRDLEQLRGRGRVWVLFSHAEGDRARFLADLDRGGTRLDTFSERGAAAYLYAL
jgi:hypothetical protein